ncbi:nucleotidyltransferase family protein [Chengkuizengella sediminis]|uniref:nucleotidyltransferase family protein n=1 Tax=Chengkuizengella sediminis TaxID=1885917 RepID=UPI0013899923|nr:nucleotidyltransferase family protein [Chengkuizengella sediminis]NDI37097.1 NTP transferase domain-containing protein [Chengkuizengella sediminis]
MSDRIVGVFLAAGKSDRMGNNKLNLPLGKQTLGSITLKTAIHSSLDHLVVVTKEQDTPQWISPFLLSPPSKKKWTQQTCKSAIKGQAYSIKCGVKKAMQLQPKAIMILLADQPFISKEMINKLINCYIQHKDAYFVAACYQNTISPPILFSHQMFPAIMQLEGDVGARYLLKKEKWRETGIILPFEHSIPFLDVDTKEDYEFATNVWKSLE